MEEIIRLVVKLQGNLNANYKLFKLYILKICEDAKNKMVYNLK